MRKFDPVILNEAICEIFNFGYRFDTGFATYRKLVDGKFEYSYALYDITTRKVLMYGWRGFTSVENKSIRDILEKAKEDTLHYLLSGALLVRSIISIICIFL